MPYFLPATYLTHWCVLSLIFFSLNNGNSLGHPRPAKCCPFFLNWSYFLNSLLLMTGWSCCASSGIWVDNSSVSFCGSFSVSKLLQNPFSQPLLPSLSADKKNSTEEPLSLFPGSSWIVWLCNCSLQFVFSRLPILFHLGKIVRCWIEMTLTYVSLVLNLPLDQIYQNPQGSPSFIGKIRNAFQTWR